MTAKTKSILFISDLHLEHQRPDISQAFFTFLKNTASQAQALYILGDFFNVWIGDDDLSELSQSVAKALQQLVVNGTQVFLMHGNRDFLLGETFASQCGAKLLSEPYLLSVDNTDYLLLHGDSLCTKDTAYIEFRSMVRNPVWQTDFLAKPLAERKAFAEKARQQSQKMNSNKAEDIMDVTSAEVCSIMNQYQVSTLIHGHTHRPATHKVSGLAGENKRIVLGDWDQQVWYIELAAKQLALKTIPLQG